MGNKTGPLPDARSGLALLGLGLVLSAAPLLPAAIGRAGSQGGSGAAANATIRIAGDGGTRMVDGVVIVKFRAPQAISRGMSRTGLSSLDKMLSAQGAYSIERAYPLPNLKLGPRGMELQRIYYVRYGSGESPRSAALKLSRDPNVEYAVPQYVHRITGLPAAQSDRAGKAIAAIPNDPLYEYMDHLRHIQAPAAWDVVKGEDGNVVIAVVDGGTDWCHEDLIDNIWQNLGEDADGDGHTLEYVDGEWVLDPGDLNGIDNDLNTFIDDLIGWNFAGNSGDPSGLESAPFNEEHGTGVAGVAAAVTDNGIGIAGASWNAQLMLVNTSCEADSFICYGYEGIIYAAANGADIINTSWGGTYTDLTPFEERQLLLLMQEIIDFVSENGGLLVSAAGNDYANFDKMFSLPSSAPHVLVVGATSKAEDGKALYSNYGVSVDIFAPGNYLNTTLPDNDYTASASGTSFSTALTSGIAALVKTQFPDLSPDQLAQQVRVTADPIDDANTTLRGLMGKGRINAYRAVTDTTIPAIRIAGTSYRDSDADGFIESGETVDITVALTNYLADAANVTVTLTQDDPNVTITDGDRVVSSLQSGDTAYADFQFIVGQVGDEYPLYFILDISTGGYQDRDLFNLYANEPVALTHDTGPLRVSLTEEGNIGWVGFADESAGEGFVYYGNNLLFEGGLLVGVSPTRVSDCIRGVNEKLEKDFGVSPGARLVIEPGQVANEEGSVTLTDQLASSPLGVTIQQDSYADDSPYYNDFIILKYTITNSSEILLTNLYAGLFFDWDITPYYDYARFDQGRRMGIVQNDPSHPTYLAATRLLTRTGDLSYRSIHNASDEIYVNVGDGFTAEKKWQFLSGGLQTQRLDAVDASTMTAAGPFAMQPGESIEIAFAVIGAGSQAALETNADTAQAFWDSAISPAQLNHPPVFTTTLPDTIITSVETLTFVYAAEDVDGDTLTFSLIDPPENAFLDSVTGELTFKPAADFKGAITITAAVSDGEFSCATSARVTVEKISNLLGQNYPNPFWLSAESGITIEYHLAGPRNVRLVVYDLLGREVKTLVSGPKAAGKHMAVWNARDNHGHQVSTGLYIYRIQAGDFIDARKLVILK